MSAQRGTIVDLFAGPGGWSEGLRMLGLSDIGIEWDRDACLTRRAAGHLTVRADVSQYPPEVFRGAWGLIASPPCQDFSLAGKRAGREGSRGELIDTVPVWVETLRPEWIACEQVPPAIDVWYEHAYTYRDLGYSTWCGILNAADYGVPQTRQRAILLASRVRTVEPPSATHAKTPHPSLFGPLELPWVTMAQALGWSGRVGFPRLDDTGSSPDGYRERDWRDASEPAFALTEKARSWVRRERSGDRSEEGFDPAAVPAQTLTSKARSWEVQSPRPHGGEQRLGLGVETDGGGVVGVGVEQGLGPEGQEADLVVGQGQGVRGHAPHSDCRPQEVNPQSWPFTHPATTVAGDPRITARCHREAGSQGADARTTDQVRAGDYAGTEPVRLTVAEALALQSFPSSYPTQGSRSSQFQQIGNAVPPLLAAHVLSAVTGVPMPAAQLEHAS